MSLHKCSKVDGLVMNFLFCWCCNSDFWLSKYKKVSSFVYLWFTVESSVGSSAETKPRIVPSKESITRLRNVI